MLKSISRITLTLTAASILCLAALPKPSEAQTLNSVLSSVGSIGQQILYGNVLHTQQPANTVVGYTQNGGTVYGDGRIVMPNGQTIYPNSNGRYPTGQYTYYNPNANPNSYIYDYNRTGKFDKTHRHGKGHAYAYGHNTPHGANPHRRGYNDDANNGNGNNGHGNNGNGNHGHGNNGNDNDNGNGKHGGDNH